MTLDLLIQEMKIKEKEISTLKNKICLQINPQREIELQNAINESQRSYELLDKEIKHLHQTTKHHSNILVKSNPTSEELEIFEKKYESKELKQ